MSAVNHTSWSSWTHDIAVSEETLYPFSTLNDDIIEGVPAENLEADVKSAQEFLASVYSNPDFSNESPVLNSFLGAASIDLNQVTPGGPNPFTKLLEPWA